MDPLTAGWLLLRDVAPAELCSQDLSVYDGRRATRMVLGDAIPTEDGVTCPGVYLRQAGYPPEDLAERTRYPFTLRYVEAGAALRLVEMRVPTPLGDAVLRRK